MIIVTVGDSIMEINLVNPKQVCLVMNNLPGAALTSVMMLNQNYVFVSGRYLLKAALCSAHALQV